MSKMQEYVERVKTYNGLKLEFDGTKHTDGPFSVQYDCKIKVKW